MAAEYNPSEIEGRWQRRWEADGIFEAEQQGGDGRPNWFSLSMFPYPSGELHIGHWYAFTPADAHARFMRMQGFNVLQPQGFDAFGLPAENAAIRHGTHPREWTYSNIENMRRQFRLMGNSYDWRREVVTCDPGYYRWNQFFFLKMMDAGLVYRDKALANWCPSCNTTLANEQVRDGACERCETAVTKRQLEQWFIKITDYANELLDMSGIEWPRKIKSMQHNWIGRSNGVNIRFKVDGREVTLEAFTTRIDTSFGIEFITIAPESELVQQLKSEGQAAAVDALKRSEIERTNVKTDKTGVYCGSDAINPFNGKRVPIFVADYVLATYGTGVVMGVPGHDQRDFDFATKHDLPITVVVAPPDWDGAPLGEAYSGDGRMVNSDEFNDMSSAEAMQAMADKAEENDWGQRTETFHIRDWLISRQRYWGTPIPVVYCEQECGVVQVPYDDLPVLLPNEAKFMPTGGSPLLEDPEFLNTSCPKCGGAAKRETDTMDTFMDSSWYHFRYMAFNRPDQPFTREDLAPWTPIHQYMGGAEHAVMHLLYARFFCKALRDMGMLDLDEPYLRLFNQGVLVNQRQKISKRSNPLSPEPLVKRYGADTVRCYLMFLGPWDQGGTWTPSGINGSVRWLKRVWALAQEDSSKLGGGRMDGEVRRMAHVTTKRVLEDMAQFKFNTAIAALMELCNSLSAALADRAVGGETWDDAVRRLLLHLAPLAPHMAEELWQQRHPGPSVHLQSSPEWDERLTTAEVCRVAVQVNGRVRGELELDMNQPQDTVVAAALATPNIARWLEGKSTRRVVHIPNKLLNLVVADE